MAPTAAAAPKLLRLDIAKQWTGKMVNNGRCGTRWSPRELLTGDASFFPESLPLSVKRSVTSRFFMYEEQGATKLDDAAGPTQVLQRSPAELAELLHEGDMANESSSEVKPVRHHHYWTSPVADVAPGLLQAHLQGFQSVHHDNNPSAVLDPRGPSLWMGTSGSATQAHYDVADNVIVQLYGTKRIRCYPPEAATALHVFPDAHPRARKSQVDWDAPDHERFGQFATLTPPVLDAVLQPGDAIRIPAFWFHHVENGRQQRQCETAANGGVSGFRDLADSTMEQTLGPSVSFNLFALSDSMMIAQRIFQDASQPFGRRHAADNFSSAVEALRALGWGLLEELQQQDRSTDSPDQFIRTALLDTRYVPLQSSGDERHHESTRLEGLSLPEQEQVAQCIARIMPYFAKLRETGGVGVQTLVVCHLLELWAVEMVGAGSVADAWEAVLRV